MFSPSDSELNCVLTVAQTLPVEMRGFYLVALSMAARVTRTQHLCLLAEEIGRSHQALAAALMSPGDHVGSSEIAIALA
jgi:hypothetical protein